MSKENFLKWFKVLNVFMKEQIISYENDMSFPLGSVLSEMCIDTWGQKKPADPAVWQDWEIITKEIFNDLNIDDAKNLSMQKNSITKEQAFMAAFHMMNEVFWGNKNNITIGEVMYELEKCLTQIENDESNSTWLEWIKYLKAEEGNKYYFDYK